MKYFLIYYSGVVSKGDTIKEVFDKIFNIEITPHFGKGVMAIDGTTKEILKGYNLSISWGSYKEELKISYSNEFTEEEILKDFYSKEVLNLLKVIIIYF